MLEMKNSGISSEGLCLQEVEAYQRGSVLEGGREMERDRKGEERNGGDI